jgi:hypothetical protein
MGKEGEAVQTTVKELRMLADLTSKENALSYLLRTSRNTKEGETKSK